MKIKKNRDKRLLRLKAILVNDKKLTELDKINEVLRFDLLSEILKNETSDKQQILINKYLSNEIIRTCLIKIHSDISDDKKSRITFGPGTFIGLQGRLNCIILTQYIIKDKLKWSLVDVVNKVSYKVLYSYKLRCSKSCFDHIYELIMSCYPNSNLKSYYFKKASHVWYDEEEKKDYAIIKEAIREFVSALTNPKGKYKYKLKNLPQWINYKLFREPVLPYDTNLSYMLSYCFGNSHIKAIMFAYPELNLKPYYFSNVPNNYWSGKDGLTNAKEVMVELMEILTNPNGQYKLSEGEVVKIFKFKTYGKPILPYRKNMRGMLQTLFKNSPSSPFKLVIGDR